VVLDIRVLEGSRPDSAGNVKYSYHVIGTNLIFACNTSPMKAFVQCFEDKLAKDKPSFLPISDDGSSRRIIDMSVYTKNRVLRTPLSFKLSDSTKTPLKLLPPWDGPNNVKEAFVTNVVAGAAGQRIFTMQDISCAIPATGRLPLRGAKSKEGASTLRARGGGGSITAQATVPAMPRDVVQQFQALLDAAGSKGCQAKNDAGSLLDNGLLSFLCQNVGTRECLACEGVTHKSNNASLHVHRDSLRVYYKCLAPKCTKQAKRFIGVLKLEPDGAFSSTSASPGQAAAEMELEDNAQPDSPYSGDQDELDHASEAGSQCSSSRTESQACSLRLQVIRELALMGPAADQDRVCSIISCAAKAAGGQPEEGVKALQAAALEWAYRSLSVQDIVKYADDEKKFRAYQDVVTSSLKLDSCIPGSLDALAELQATRNQTGSWFGYQLDCQPHANGYYRNMPADSFTRRLNPLCSHGLSVVLAARHLWPGELAQLKHFVTFRCVRSTVLGLEDANTFAKVWDFKQPEAAEDFVQCPRERILIMVQPFLRDVLPSVMGGTQVASYQLFTDALSFTLDSKVYQERCVEYQLDFCSGDITSSRGEGIIYQMYKVRQYFARNGNINMMAEILVKDSGIKNKLRFDGDSHDWRIFEETKGTWIHPVCKNEPEAIVSKFIQAVFLPLQDLEQLFGREIVWEDQCENEQAVGGDQPSDICPSESVSQAGSKRARSTVALGHNKRRSKLSKTLSVLAENPKYQTEILKILQREVVISFTSMQKSHLICCPNGLVDLRTGELIRKPQPDDFVTEMCITEYDPHADITPAIDVIKRFFPPGAFPDQQELVDFLQQYFGYCLTRETDQQFSLCIYGVGSNGKSIISKMLQHVLGSDICKSIPYESLQKARGENNDALYDARNARMITLEEINGKGKGRDQGNTGTFKNMVSGDVTNAKAMYQKAVNFKPVSKLIFALNRLPDIIDSDFAVNRRFVIAHFATLFLDEEKEIEKQHADELRRSGQPECLIQKKDATYFSKHVEGQEQAILRFIILGCVVYFQRRYITIPARWQKAGTKALLRPEEVVQSFVTASLFPAGGHLTPFDDIEKAFREFAGDCVNHNTFTKQALGKELSRIIQEKAKNTVGWGDAYRKQGMHPVHKETRVIIWHNVGLRQQRQLVANSFAPPQRSSK
jgi:P4 family phage/plasmid primase-like protien